ncbi:hypothetical protein ABIF97_004906 [Bradyrhizobium japonicum]
MPAIATTAQIAQLSSPGCSRSEPAGDCFWTAARSIEAMLLLSVCWKRGLGEGSGLGEPMAVAERQRELHQHREQREPGAVPDIRPEPLHLEKPPHIARINSPDLAML